MLDEQPRPLCSGAAPEQVAGSHVWRGSSQIHAQGQISAKGGAHLWQERFHSYRMDERHLLSAVRYVEMNPVHAGLVERAEDWEWSSARYHLGLSSADWLVRERSLLGLEQLAGVFS